MSTDPDTFDMPNMFSEGLSWLADQLKMHASAPVTYVRGLDSVDLRAVLGQDRLKVSDNLGGLRVRRTDMDFLIKAEDLVLAGAETEPLRNDLVHMTQKQGAVIQIFEVMPYGDEPEWRWADPNHVMYRIHTKLLRSENLY